MRLRAGVVALLGLVFAQPGVAAQEQPSGTLLAIIKLELKISNAYLVRGTSKPILIDSGSPKDRKHLVKLLRKNHVELRDLGLIVLTHGHADHAGLCQFVQHQSGADVIAGAGDVDMFKLGKNLNLLPQSRFAQLIQPLADFPYDPCMPKVLVSVPLELTPYGLDGTVVPMPGHTAGAVVVILQDKRAFVGDMILGGYFAGAMFNEKPREHYFHENAKANRENIQTLLNQGIETFYLGHGGPVTRERVMEWLNKNPLD